MLRRRLLLAAAVTAVIASAPGNEVGAQTYPSTLRAECVGFSLFCSQVDFYLTLGPGHSATLDVFSMTLTSPGWAFLDPNQSEGEDAEGNDPFVIPDVRSPKQIVADFGFGALVTDVAPLRMRFEVITTETDISTLGLRYSGGPSDDPDAVFGRFGVAAVPEPQSILLLATGLVALGCLLRRSRSRRRA